MKFKDTFRKILRGYRSLWIMSYVTFLDQLKIAIGEDQLAAMPLEARLLQYYLYLRLQHKILILINLLLYLGFLIVLWLLYPTLLLYLFDEVVALFDFT